MRLWAIHSKEMIISPHTHEAVILGEVQLEYIKCKKKKNRAKRFYLNNLVELFEFVHVINRYGEYD